MSKVLSVLFLLTLAFGISFYISNRLHRGLSAYFTRVQFPFVFVAVTLLTLLVVISFGRSFLPLHQTVKYVIGVIGSYCMGIFVYLLLYTVLSDLVLLVLRIAKAQVITNGAFRVLSVACVLVLAFFTCVYGFINAKNIKHVSYTSHVKGDSISDLNMVMISDLHLGAVCSEDRLGKIVEEINSKAPDIVCIVGDFFDTDFKSIRNPEKAINTLKEINSTFGVYACLGNHDGGETYVEMVDFLWKANITLLNDEYRVIDNRLVLIGRRDSHPIGGYDGETRKPLEEILPKEAFTLPTVVMDHNPKHVETYGNEVDLVLCGHTHKGQLFPANIITNSLFVVDYGYYQKDVNSPEIIVSSGVGFWGMPMRVGSFCEIVSISFSDKN